MATPISNMTVTWNNAGTTFNAIKMNVTDTASNAASLLMDLQVGGTSRFRVDKAGKATATTGDSTTGGFRFVGLENIGMYVQATNLGAGSNILAFRSSNGIDVGINSAQFRLNNGINFGWSSSGDATAAGADTLLARDAANTLAQRNAANAQIFRVYNTFTDASNYERLSVGWNANIASITTAAAGTGVTRALNLRGSELYLSGSTAGDQWYFQSTGNLLPIANNTYNIGNNSSRVRTLFLGTSLDLTGSLTGTAADSSVTISPTWNTTGTPTAILLNVTDTASNAASKLLDLGTGGGSFVSRFSVGKTGGLTFNLASPTGSDPQIRLSATQSIYTAGSTTWIGSSSGTGNVGTVDSTFLISGSGDIQLTRDAANTLAQRNATNAQTFNVYNTYTSSTNYERGFLKWNTNVLQIGTEKGSGGGTGRDLAFYTDGALRLTIDATGGVSYSAVQVSFNSQVNLVNNRGYAGAGLINSANLLIASNSTKSLELFSDATSGRGIIIATSTGIVQFAGTTSSFPALKRNSTALETKLADDSAYAAHAMQYLDVTDGVTAPASATGRARIYVDTADGDLKVIFGDGTVKTIVTDT